MVNLNDPSFLRLLAVADKYLKRKASISELKAAVRDVQRECKIAAQKSKITASRATWGG